MPDAKDVGMICTQKGRVIYERKKSVWHFRDFFRIGKKQNLRFWLVPGRLWLEFLDKAFGLFGGEDGLGEMPVQMEDWDTKRMSTKYFEYIPPGFSFGQTDEIAIVFVNRDVKEGLDNG